MTWMTSGPERGLLLKLGVGVLAMCTPSDLPRGPLGFRMLAGLTSRKVRGFWWRCVLEYSDKEWRSSCGYAGQVWAGWAQSYFGFRVQVWPLVFSMLAWSLVGFCRGVVWNMLIQGAWNYFQQVVCVTNSPRLCFKIWFSWRRYKKRGFMWGI